jgi:hypothetical protein
MFKPHVLAVYTYKYIYKRKYKYKYKYKTCIGVWLQALHWLCIGICDPWNEGV